MSKPNRDRSLGGLTAREGARSLAGSLGATVDGARQLVADLGLRPYRIFSVVEQWDSGVVGRGRVTRVRELELVPPPTIDFNPLRRKYGPAGSVERGEVVMRKISPRYSEDDIRSLLVPEIQAGQTAYIEARDDGRNVAPGGQAPKRRRFVIAGAPWLDAERFEWMVRLRQQDNARTRRGRPAGG